MFDDPKKELKRLEKQLLAEEEDTWLDAQLEEAHALLGDTPRDADMDETRVFRPLTGEQPVRNYANGYGGASYMDEQDPEEYYDEDSELSAGEPRQKGLGLLVLLALLESLAIVAIIGYWLIQIL